MITSITGATFAAMANVGQAISVLHDAASNTQGDIVQSKASIIEILQKSLSDLSKVAVDLELDATISSSRICNELLNGARSTAPDIFVFSKIDIERLAWSLQAFRINFSTQMSSRLVLVLGSKHSKYLTSNEPPFETEVDDVFPMVSEEVAEAAKCLALQRSTAVVFHLMRAMELAVQKIAERLGIVMTERVWGNLLSDISKCIEAMPKGSQRDEWSACHSHLYHVKQTWRNDTMHPKKTYTEQEAETVFEAVKSFMTHLARLVIAQPAGSISPDQHTSSADRSASISR